jgi:hypothetical protein
MQGTSHQGDIPMSLNLRIFALIAIQTNAINKGIEMMMPRSPTPCPLSPACKINPMANAKPVCKRIMFKK